MQHDRVGGTYHKTEMYNGNGIPLSNIGSLFPLTVLPTPDPSNHNQMQHNTIKYVQHICPNTTMYNKLFLVTVLPKPDPKWNCPKHWETHNAR